MKAFGSTRRSRNTTTENLAGSWTRTATASSCGNRCRKSSCPGHCTRASDIISFVASGLASLCECLQAWNALKAAGPNHHKSAGDSAHPHCHFASLEREYANDPFSFVVRPAGVCFCSIICLRSTNCEIRPTSRKRLKPRDRQAREGARRRLEYCGEHGEK